LKKSESKNLTAPEIAGQLVMPRIDFNSTGYLQKAERLVGEFNVTGFIIFNGNVEQVRKTALHLQSLSKYSLFFGIDAERGLGQIVEGGTRFPFLMSQGASDNIELLQLQAENTAKEMSYCGLNLLFAPVLDVNTNPHNPIVNIRAFGDDAKLVARLGVVYSEHIKKHGVFACGKHFPGHGSTDTDSHVELPVLSKSLDDLMKLEFVPFKKAIESEIDFIMVGHLAVDEIDNSAVPATISKKLLTDVLRKQLGFNKVIITDSFRMGALKRIGEEHDIAIKSMEAGCDIILDPVNAEVLIEKFTEKINKDEKFASLAKKSVARLFDLKKGIKAYSDILPDKNESYELVNRIARESICQLRGGATSNKIVDVNIFDVTNGEHNLCKPFLDKLIENGMEINSVNYISEDYDFNKTYEHDILNVVVTTVSAWTKYSVLTKFYKSILSHISNERVNKILVSFGSPHFIAEFIHYNIVISSFEIIVPCQQAAAELLMGKISSNAKLPIKF